MNIVDLNVCRVCLKPIKFNTGKSIKNDINLLEKFHQATDIKICEPDALPSIICNRCHACLKIAYEFRRQAIISDGRLRAFIEKINNQFNKVATNTTILKYDGEFSNEDELIAYVESQNDDNNHIEEQEHDNNPVEQQEHDSNTDIVNKLDDINAEGNSYANDYEAAGDGNFSESGTVLDTEYEIGDWQMENSNNENEICKQEKTNTTAESYVLTEIVIDPLKFNPNKIMKKSIQRQAGKNEKSKLKMGHHICTKCNKDFSTSSNLQRHLDTHDGLRPFQCNLCNKGFTQNGSLKKHMLIHTGEKPHVCDVCGRGFTQHTSLVFHIRRHTGERPFPCDQCDRAFRMRDALKRHIQERHIQERHLGGSKQKVHICSICNRVLRSKYSLQIHMQRHSDSTKIEKNYKCDSCDKCFKTSQHLKSHIKSHKNTPLVKCDECEKYFKSRKLLISHLKTHLEIKPYKCKECDKSFLQEKLLEDHIHYMHRDLTIIKENSKLFECETCRKQYKIKENLLQHMKTHIKKPTTHKCDECEITFDTIRRYKLHRANKHDEIIGITNECYYCYSEFLTLKDLNNHLQEQHDSIDETCQECNKHFLSKKSYDSHRLQHQEQYA